MWGDDGGWCKKCDPDDTGPRKSDEEMRSKDVCRGCYNKHMRELNAKNNAKNNAKRTAEDIRAFNAKRSAEDIQAYNERNNAKRTQATIQASNAKRDLDSARQKEKVEWERIMRVYGPPSDYDPNEDDHDDYPSSVGESIDENDMKGFTSDSNDDGSNASADDSSDMSENDDSVSIRGKHAQGRISAGSKAPGAKDKKMLPAKSATSTSDYPTPPWSCRLS